MHNPQDFLPPWLKAKDLPKATRRMLLGLGLLLFGLFGVTLKRSDSPAAWGVFGVGVSSMLYAGWLIFDASVRLIVVRYPETAVWPARLIVIGFILILALTMMVNTP